MEVAKECNDGGRIAPKIIVRSQPMRKGNQTEEQTEDQTERA
jgi:hypothetical protein